MSFLETTIQSLVIGLISGGVSAAAVTEWLRRRWRPKVAANPQFMRVSDVTFDRHTTKTPDEPVGDLYKIVFRLAGKQSPEFCALEIEWETTSGDEMRVFGKWDEAPMPLAKHQLGAFRPELVPQTYFQPILLDRDYAIPVLVSPHGQESYEVFSGWWFGLDHGYKTGAREIGLNTELRLRLSGATGQYWKRDVRVAEIVEEADEMGPGLKRLTADGRW